MSGDANEETAALMQISTHIGQASASSEEAALPVESSDVAGNSTVTASADGTLTGQPAESDLPVTPLCEVPAIPSSQPVPFTVFDEIYDFRTFASEPHWVERDFIAEAISSARIDAQLWARVLRYELASQPSPQIMLTHDRGDDLRRGVVLDFTPFGGLPVTFDLPDGSSLAEAVQVLAVLHADTSAARAYQGLCACHSNGIIVDAAAPLPADANVVQFYVLHDTLPSASHDLSNAPTPGHVTVTTPIATPAVPDRALPAALSLSVLLLQTSRSMQYLCRRWKHHQSGLYIVFDQASQVQRRVRQPHWHDADCLNDAVTHST